VEEGELVLQEGPASKPSPIDFGAARWWIPTGGIGGSFSPLWSRWTEIFCTHTAKNFRVGPPRLLIILKARQ